MNLSKSLLLIPAASFFLAVAVGSGACGTSVSIGVPVGEEPVPTGDYPVGITATTACDSNTYLVDGDGWLLCEDGFWTGYTTTDPDSTGGWSAAAGDDAGGDDASKTGDDATGDDATGDDATGDDATGDDATGDDATSDDASGDDASGDDSGGDDSGTPAVDAGSAADAG